LVVNPTSGDTPLAIKISGTLKDSDGIELANKTLILLLDGSTVANWSTTTNSSGNFSSTHTLNSARGYILQIKFIGDILYQGCEESQVVNEEGSKVP
jgi:hypothetical protein